MSTITDITLKYASGEDTPVRLTEALLAAIAARDGAIRAFTHVDAAGARAAAGASARRWKAGQALSPLDGIPVTIKDNIAVAGLPWTAGMAHRRGVVAGTDAVVVARLRAAGAIIIGMSNMHEAALGSTTDNPFYGRTDNPAVPGHTPGGSSGGTAAAVAAGFVPLGIGSDTLGSVRLPASYCGVTGLKPTPGLLPKTGVADLSWSLDTIGPIAASIGDLALCMQTIGSHDPGDADAEDVPAGWRRPAAAVELRSLNLARLSTGAAPVDGDVRRAFDAALEIISARCAGLPTVTLDGWVPRETRRAGLLIVEAEAASVHQQALAANAPMSDTLRAMLDYGRTLPAPRLAEAIRDFAATGLHLRQLLTRFDALLLPVAPQPAFPHGTPAPASQADFTALANAARCPALSMPLPVPPGAHPVGLQLIGRRFDDLRLLAIADVIARELAA